MSTGPLPASPYLPACINHPHAPAVQRCSRCGHGFCSDCLVPLKGQLFCGTCKHAQLSGSFRVSGAVPVAPPIPDAPCALHPNNAASQVCERCGDFMCGLCSTAFEGRFYCLRCFDLLWQRGGLGSAPRTLPDARLALGLAIGALAFFWTMCLPWVPALGAFIMACTVIGRTSKDPDLPGRSTAIAALVVSLVAIAATIVFIAFLGSR